jgi:hypothetical protein
MRRVAVVLLVWILSIAAAAKAETIYAVVQESNPNALTVSGNEALVSFDSAAPGSFLSNVHLGNHAGSVVGMDHRPATGQLYLLTMAKEPSVVLRLFLVDRATGALSQVGADIDLGVGGVDPPAIEAGFDFDPVRDLAVVSVGAVITIDPETGQSSSESYFVPASPRIAGLAFDRSFAGAAATTLFGIELSRAQLVRIGGVDGAPSPDDGAVTDLGFLGLAPNEAAFDISSSGTAYAVFPSPFSEGLYTVDLASGGATLVGIIGTGQPLSAMAVAPGAAAAAIPSLGEWGQLVLAAALAVAALRVLSRV